MLLKHFKNSEFDSKDLPGSGSYMQNSTLQMLDNARELAGVPFHINSGFRTPEHNAKVGGSPTSSHLKGYAADIAVTPFNKSIILSALIRSGFKRIGIGSTFIHSDNDPEKPNATWSY